MGVMKKHRPPLLLLAIAAGLYGLALFRFYVGSFNDDGVYVLGAKALLQGHYGQLNLPDHPPLTLYPPGFPLLLAPILWAVEPAWAWLKIVPFLLTLGSSVLLWKVFEPWLSYRKRLLLVGLYALHPITVGLSGTLMSESCALFAVLALLWALQHINEQSPWMPIGGVGLLLGWATLIRADTVSLFPSLLIAVVYFRKWRSWGVSLCIGTSVWGIYVLRNLYAAHSATGYSLYWKGMLPYLTGSIDHYAHWIHHAARMIVMLFCGYLFAWSPSEHVLVFALQGGVSLVCMGVALRGVRRFVQAESPEMAPLLLLSMYVFFYFLIHAMWLSWDERYFLPIFPFVWAMVLRGVEIPASAKSCRQAFVGIVLGTIGLSYFAQNVEAVYDTFHRQTNLLPHATYSWMREHVPADALMLASGPAVVTLYTQRFATLDVAARDAEEFRYQLLKKHIRYVLFHPAQYCSIWIPYHDPNQLWVRRARWVSSSPDAFQKVYANSAEERVIYRVSDAPQYLKAYELYLSALADFQSALPALGFSKLRESLVLYPALASALNAYAIQTLLSPSPDLSLAESKLRQALRVLPDSPIVLLNLARVYERKKQRELAQQFCRRALEAIQQTGDFQSLRPRIEQECHFDSINPNKI